MTANRLVLLMAVPLFLVLAVVTYITVQFAENERVAQFWVRHTYEVQQQLGQVLSDAQDAETGQRGYLLTHRPDFLTPYREGRARIDADLAKFRRLTSDNPSQQQRASRLGQLVSGRFSAFDATLALAQNAPSAASPALIAALDEGKQRMDALRRQIAQGMDGEAGLLRQRDETRRNQERLEIGFAAGAGIITLVILLLAAALLVRNNISLTASERARAREARILRTTLDTMHDGVAYFDARGALRVFNAHFFTLLGLPDHLARDGVRLADLATSAQAWPVSVFAPAKTGEVGQTAQHLSLGERELDIYRAQVAAGSFLIGVADVTARMRAEAVLRQAQKMEAIGHLTGGVAHDFNNLLQIIGANLDLAANSPQAAASTDLGARLDNALEAVMRGARLTGQLLAFARRQALDPRSVDMGRIIRDMTDLLRRTIGEQVEIETVVAGGLWNTLVDPTQVENTILNLAINARDAMPVGGKLTLEVANAHLDDAYAAAHAEVEAGQYVLLAVSDTGSGMTDDVLARVFEPFYSTKPEGKGTGLGLAQAYGFVKQSAGHIKIYSEPGHGTTIKLYLPRTRRERDAREEASRLPVQGGSEYILVVEDDEAVQHAVIDMLKDLGYRVASAGNAEAALALLHRGEKPDLLFTDVVMPGAIPTRDFTRRAQEINPGMRVLYTSGYTQNAIVHNGKLDDDASLLSKPYRKDELARKLRSVLAGTARGPIAAPRGKVLVVEDIALIRRTTLDMVEQLGFAAAEASDAAEALAILDKDQEIAILLTDLGLPDMNGRQLVAEALRRKPQLKVIIASGYSSDPQDKDEANDKARYLTKPFDLAQLRRALGV